MSSKITAVIYSVLKSKSIDKYKHLCGRGEHIFDPAMHCDL